MVLIIAGEAKSGSNTVCQRLAEALGWELIDAENLRPPQNVDQHRRGTSLADADPPLRVETLSAAINLWVYEWRDVVVSCPLLAEGEQKLLSRMSSLVKIVCLDEFHTADPGRVSDRSVGSAISQPPAGAHTSRQAEHSVLTLNLARPVEEIIAELTAVLMT